ncbi:MAG: DDE-type integrase/transposase/recombinase, partial [Armatimonadetes bacterium]|nr:DDE-type integrase/transposase/recombinase [Armatimonadota bacterium]
QRKIKRKHPRRLARNRVITASNQLWEVDVKYGYIAGEDRFFFIMPIIDVFDRWIVAYHIGLSCEAKDAVITLKSALFKRHSRPWKVGLASGGTVSSTVSTMPALAKPSSTARARSRVLVKMGATKREGYEPQRKRVRVFRLRVEPGDPVEYLEKLAPGETEAACPAGGP